MEPESQPLQGFVYILEVRDIMLPVCKIGMTRRDPETRCREINVNSTGDFLWSVTSSFAVSDCQGLESLIHKKLAPLRQKGREFFNLKPEDAKVAITSILEAQSEIVEVDIPLPEQQEDALADHPPRQKRKKLRRVDFSAKDSEYADILLTFAQLLGVTGRPFGQLGKPKFGVSDGSEGVQWNLQITKDTGEIRLGVNLEGMAYDGWPIATLLLNEREEPTIATLKGRVSDPERVTIDFCRDAWLPFGRLTIKEKHLGGGPYSLSDLNIRNWQSVVEEGLSCLDVAKNFRGRGRQAVTSATDSRTSERPVSPHLNISAKLKEKPDHREMLNAGFDLLRPAYEWVKHRSTV